MSKNKPTKAMREILPALKKNGYVYSRCKGSHFVFTNKATGHHVSVNKDLNNMVKMRLLKEIEEDYANANYPK